MTLREKFNKILKHNELGLTSIEDIAQYCGLKVSTLYRAMTRNEEQGGDLSTDTVKTIVDKIGLRWEWWDEQKDPMFKEKSYTGNKTNEPTLNEKSEDPYELIRILARNIDRLGETNEYLLKRVKELGG
jgi:hypothetical protein